MATRRFGISQGEDIEDVTEAVGAAVNADTVEVTVDLADGMTRAEVLMALDKLKAHIFEVKWPPA